MKHVLAVLLALSALLAVPTTAQSKPTFQDLIAGQPYCADSIEDQSAPGNCIPASSVPTIGMLYPLSGDFFIDPSTGALHVNGQVVAGQSSVASGLWSSVSGGRDNVATQESSVVSGGDDNTAGGFRSVVSGGHRNIVYGPESVVCGGRSNSIPFNTENAAVGGGLFNQAYGHYSCVPGGFLNTAEGQSSFACGRDAHALHDHSFVWSGTTATFNSTGDGQFLIDAPGGVGIGTNVPDVALDVAGAIEATDRISTSNPNNAAASVHLSWLDDVARLRVGGSGAGAQNGLDIQTISNNSLMRITGAGNVGIGTTTPTSRLDVNGTIRCTSLTQTSDARLKTNVRELDEALDKVRALRGVSFDWDLEQLPEADEERRLGFLAQEVREVVPEVVHEDAQGTLAVAYAELVPVLVEAIQELEARVAELEAGVEQ